MEKYSDFKLDKLNQDLLFSVSFLLIACFILIGSNAFLYLSDNTQNLFNAVGFGFAAAGALIGLISTILLFTEE